ncbi:MAG: hypothetical protein JXA50_01875 [Deltaproteobacteria bacterium]|nr:hypothetical protein [Deltaproteobacteria bacterium]
MTIYYVNSDPLVGNDSNDGLSEETPWLSLTKVNAVTFSPGDHIKFIRGGAWYGQLYPLGDGTAENRIYFEAYGEGSPPIISGLKPLQESDWSLDGGNIWKTTITAADRVYFNGVWGDKKTAKVDCINKYDYYWASNTLYVYSEANPATWYGVSIEVLFISRVVYIRRNYITVRQIYMRDSYSEVLFVYNNTGCQFEYCIIDGGLFRLGVGVRGVYLYSTTNCNLYNCAFIRSTRGIEIIGGSGGHNVKNSVFWGHSYYTIYDPGVNITYDYNHFYGNTGALGSDEFDVIGTTRVSGGTDGGHNIVESRPYITDRKAWTIGTGVRIDDLGFRDMTALIDTVATAYATSGIKMLLGVTTAGAYVDANLKAKLNTWHAQGHIIAGHSRTHQKCSLLNGMAIRYVGAGSACTTTIAGDALTTSVTGGPGGENLNIDLTNASYDTMAELVAYINGLAAYTCTISGSCQAGVHSDTLADVAAQDIRTVSYTALLDKERLVRDELSGCKADLESWVSGLTVTHYIWPFNESDADTRAWADDEGYECSWAVGVADAFLSFQGANILSLHCPPIDDLEGEDEDTIKNKVREFIFLASIRGLPTLMYCHDELDATEHGWVKDALVEMGGFSSAAEILAYLKAGVNPLGYQWGVGESPIDMQPGDSSPLRDVGTDLGLIEDIIGRSVPQETNPTIGAYEWLPTALVQAATEVVSVIETAANKLLLVKAAAEVIGIIEQAAKSILAPVFNVVAKTKRLIFESKEKTTVFKAKAKRLIFKSEDKSEDKDE